MGNALHFRCVLSGMPYLSPLTLLGSQIELELLIEHNGNVLWTKIVNIVCTQIEIDNSTLKKKIPIY